MSNFINFDDIWTQLDNLKSPSLNKNTLSSNKIDKIISCNSCGNINQIEQTYETICLNCGLVLNTNFCTTTPSFESIESIPVKKYSSGPNNKLKKMQEWYMWTNDEKSQYKLKLYTKNLCQKLDVLENLIDNTCDIVFKVMDAIKKHDGTKRARVKDGIILVCIQYVYYHHNYSIHKPSAIELAKKIELDIKYVTKAEKIVLEILNKHPNILNKTAILDIKKPIQYVYHVNTKHNLQISKSILDKVEYLIDKCEKNNILLDHTPLSIGVCCLYYILKLNSIEIDLKLFSTLYNLSIVTVMKTYNKLKSQHHLFLESV